MRSNLRERKVSKDITKEKNAWRSFNPCDDGKQNLKRI